MNELETLVVSRQYVTMWEDVRMQLKAAIERREKARTGTEEWHTADTDVQKWGRNFRSLEKIYNAAGGSRT